MSLLKKTITAILIVAMALAASSLAVSATTDDLAEQDFVLSQDTLDADSLPSSDELLTGYLEKEIYPPISTFGRSAYDLLNDNEKMFYNAIKQGILSVAAGETASTRFKVTSGISDFSWTATELGVQELVIENDITVEAETAIKAKLAEMISTGDIMRALTSDIPCELFWFNKTEGMSTTFSTQALGSKAWIASFSFSFFVSPDFYGQNELTVDSQKITAINDAKSTAQSIVSKHAEKSDFDKLTAYKNEICTLTDYYSGDLNGAYGNPWQLIWVFDNNPLTNVVCEGYSKAFKYLCDLSQFSAPVYCYLVTGSMATTGDPGPHMWNLVEVSGKNYLVDVTNSDSESVGHDGSLFMVGASTRNNGAVFQVEEIAVYAYDTQNIGNYLTDGVFLPVSETSYAHDINHLFNVTVTDGNGSGSYAEGAIVTLTTTPTEKQEFMFWSVTGGGVVLDNSLSETATFIMPTTDVTVSAIYHTHQTGDTLIYDENGHWYEFECGCSGKYQNEEHTYTRTELKPTSCKEEGTELLACDCGYEYEQAIEKLAHKYDSGVVTKEATVDAPGTRKYTCKECGETYLDIIPKLAPSVPEASDDEDLLDDTDEDETEGDTNDLYDEPSILGGCDASVSTTALTLVSVLCLAIAPKKKSKQ